MSFQTLMKSLRRAVKGLARTFQEEQNFRIQVIAGIFVLAAATYLQIKFWQFIVLVLVIFSLLILELINTVIEKLVDIIHPRIHDYAAIIKDLMAAAVLLAAIVTVVIVIIILGPYVVAS